MKIGDKIRMKNLRNPNEVDISLYVIVEIHDTSVKVKHPKIEGHFIFAKRNIAEVIDEVGS